MKPRVRVWIDARHEKYVPGKRQEVDYRIKDIQEPQVREKVYYTLASLVWKIHLPHSEKDRVKIIYDPERITPSFIDYLLQQKEIAYERLNP